VFEPAALAAFFQVVVIDLVLAGDNAVVIGMAAAGLPLAMRNRAILVGIIAATVLRILFATVAMSLMAIGGLVLAGGLLLLWVCWKMWRELRTPRDHGKTELSAERLEAQRGLGPRHSVTPPRRLSWRTYRCRSTTCSPSLAPHASIRGCWSSDWCCRSA
jgi:predicted tellurium resistance membrane protein TerC